MTSGGGWRRVRCEGLWRALNGRPGACQGVGIEGWVKQGMGSHLGRKRARKGQELALRMALNGRPRAWDRSGGECCGLFCFASTTFIFALTFSRGESERVSLPLRLPLPLPFPLPLPLPFGGAPIGWEKSASQSKSEGPSGPGEVRLHDSARERGRTFKARGRALRRQGAGERWGGRHEMAVGIDRFDISVVRRVLENFRVPSARVNSWAAVRTCELELARCWAMSWLQSGRLMTPSKNEKRAKGMNNRVDGLGWVREVTRGCSLAQPPSDCVV